MDIIENKIDGRIVRIYRQSNEIVPVIFDTAFEDISSEVLEACANNDVPVFNLVTISNIHWDYDLSPWKCGRLLSDDDEFEGHADEYLGFLSTKVVPFVKSELKTSADDFVLAGYSMAGMFSLYAACNTDIFRAVVSASGSLWYPEFEKYINEHEMNSAVKKIYLSIGDRESRTRNQYLQQTEGITKRLCELFQKRGIESTFTLNKGNHFQHVPERMANGFKWVL